MPARTTRITTTMRTSPPLETTGILRTAVAARTTDTAATGDTKSSRGNPGPMAIPPRTSSARSQAKLST